MLWHCLKYTEKADRENPVVTKMKNGRIMLLSNCVVCDSKKWDLSENNEQKDC